MTVISRPDPIRRLLRWGWVAGMCATAAVAQTPETVRESVDVVELSVLADVPARRGTLNWDPVGAGDVEVFEDGAQKEVTGLDALDDVRWRVLVWIDGERCDPTWLAFQLKSLAGYRDELEALGDLEVVVADPTPRRLTAPASVAGWEALVGESGRAIGCRDTPAAE